MNRTMENAEREQRLKRWIEEYRTPLLRTCVIYLSDYNLAEDVVQETFLKAWKAMDSFEGRNGSSEKTWLVSIAINACKDQMRKRWFRHIDSSKALDELPERTTNLPIKERDILIDISRLPEKYKAVVLLRFYQNMTQTEIAAVLGVSRSVVGKRLKKALDMLRITLGEEGQA